MISGKVKEMMEAYLPLTILSHLKEPYDLEFAVDTAFSGFISLPMQVIRQLGLVYFENRAFRLADDSLVEFDLFEAIVYWGGNPREINVVAADGPPSIGMALLRGYKICIDVVDGGDVFIEARVDG